MVGGRGKPDAIVGCLIWFVAEDQDDLVIDIDREAAEHGAGSGRQGRDCLEDEFVRDGLAALRREGREIRRQEARTATGLWHAKGRLREWLAYELCAAGFCFQQLRYTSSLWRGEGSRSAAQEHKRCFRRRARFLRVQPLVAK